jgi:hypothetical protein
VTIFLRGRSKGKPSRHQKPAAAYRTISSGTAGKARKQPDQISQINQEMCLTAYQSQGMLIGRSKAHQPLSSARGLPGHDTVHMRPSRRLGDGNATSNAEKKLTAPRFS